MNAHQRTRAPRVAAAVKGAAVARRHIERARIIAGQLDLIAPGTVRVHIVPVTTADRRRTWVELVDASGRTVSTAAEQCRAALGLLRRMLPDADWSRALVYDVRAGRIADDTPAAPAALGLDTAPPAEDTPTLAFARVEVQK